MRSSPVTPPPHYEVIVHTFTLTVLAEHWAALRATHPWWEASLALGAAGGRGLGTRSRRRGVSVGVQMRAAGAGRQVRGRRWRAAQRVSARESGLAAERAVFAAICWPHGGTASEAGLVKKTPRGRRTAGGSSAGGSPHQDIWPCLTGQGVHLCGAVALSDQHFPSRDR
ncbi:Hypothetical predicted protein [Marmota monax]|uniref:Uncharacterized protein n=1 Tax=Marmota monax TaxID=9995 RepID=A0A5E4A9M4_MARMO|nr:Hypothetical predicted protein [Marmota monax]